MPVERSARTGDSTRRTPRRCATRRARPDGRRACSIRIVPLMLHAMLPGLARLPRPRGRRHRVADRADVPRQRVGSAVQLHILRLRTGAAGPYLDAKSVAELLVERTRHLTAGVPTVWLALLTGARCEPGQRTISAGCAAIVVGGSAAPPSMIRGFQERHKLTVVHAWGMTEMTPGRHVLPSARDRSRRAVRRAVSLPRQAGHRRCRSSRFARAAMTA